MDKVRFGDAEQNDISFVRQVVLHRFREDHGWNQAQAHPDTRVGYATWVEFQSTRHYERFIELADTILWELITLGVILPGSGSGGNPANFNLPSFRLTDFGRKVVEAASYVPNDPGAYLSASRACAPDLVTNVMQGYLEEALNCFARNCYAASLLLLGVAAEAGFLELCTLLTQCISDLNAQAKFKKIERVKDKHRWIVKRYDQLPANRKARDLPDGLDVTFSGIYDLIRRQRNALGHPQAVAPNIDREHAFAHFQLFLTYLRDAQALVKSCQTHGF
jgi:hypothetical protein